MRIHNKNININLKPGIYLLDFKCSSGKTYLCKLLKALSAIDDSVLGLSYSDSKDILNTIRNFKGNVLMLDRVDLYYSPELIKIISELKDCVILLDLKNTDLCNSFVRNLATIEMFVDGIEVSLL